MISIRVILSGQKEREMKIRLLLRLLYKQTILYVSLGTLQLVTITHLFKLINII